MLSERTTMSSLYTFEKFSGFQLQDKQTLLIISICLGKSHNQSIYKNKKYFQTNLYLDIFNLMSKIITIFYNFL